MNKTLGPQIKNFKNYYSYSGSETAPDCKENVNWYIFTDNLLINSNELIKFTKFWETQSSLTSKGNNRAIQNLNGRVIKLGGNQCEKDDVVLTFALFLLFCLVAFVLSQITY